MEKINPMSLVRDYIKENRFSQASIARTMGTTPKSFRKRIESGYVDSAYLVRLCRALNHDFFADISELMGMPKEKDNTIADLEKEIEFLKREKELLKEMIQAKMS